MRALVLFLAACGGPADPDIPFPNPTGDCTAPDDGGRRCWHTPGSGTWYPDCDPPLDREYWRVFVESDGTAWMMPRPDGAPPIAAACADEEHPQRELLERLTLCGPVDVDLLNAMNPADALTLGHWLHTELDFEARVEGDQASIVPYVPFVDEVEACRHTDNPALDDYCADRFAFEGAGTCPGETDLVMDAAVAEAMANAVDAVYGVAH